MNSQSNSLVDRVKQYLRDKFEVDYVGRLHYKVEDTIYELKWDLNNQMQPMIMVGEFETEDEFYDYVVKQIGIRRPFAVGYFVARRINAEDMPKQKEQINKQC